MCGTVRLDFSHCLSPLLKALLLVSVGREFQSLASFTEGADWQKEVLHCGKRDSPQVDARVVALTPDGHFRKQCGHLII